MELKKQDIERKKVLEKTYKEIFKAIEPLTNMEAIVQLEAAKLDILFNDKIVVLDGKSGKIVNES